MKYVPFALFIVLFCVPESKAQVSGFPTGLGIEIDGDFSLLENETLTSYPNGLLPGLFISSASAPANSGTMNNSQYLGPSFRYTQSSLYTHSHRRNAEAFTSWRPIDNRYNNRTQIFIDGARGLFQVIRGQ